MLAKLEAWQDLKFGLLMHWGSYSQWGIVESWSICAEDEGWCRRKNEDYTAYKKEYEGLKNSFNPVSFDPALWAIAAKDAGVKYVVFTTKHHDGFCMFDTKQTDYKVTDPGYKFQHYQSQDIRMDELVVKARAKQPGLIVVDRAVPGKNQNYLTPENEVPEHTLPYPWESCIISGGSWSWVPDAKYKTPKQVIHLLADIVAKGGNLLLNIAPGPDGKWDEGAYEMLSGVGDWMEVNSEAIYGTHPMEPYKEGKVCLTQAKDGAVYMIYLADENETTPPSKIWFSSLEIPAEAKAVMLGSKESLEWEKVGGGIVVNVPESLQKKPSCSSAWVIRLAE